MLNYTLGLILGTAIGLILILGALTLWSINKHYSFWDKISNGHAYHRLFFKRIGCLHQFGTEDKMIDILGSKKISSNQRSIIMKDLFGDSQECLFGKESHTYNADSEAFVLCLKIFILLENPNIPLSAEDISILNLFISKNSQRIDCFINIFKTRGEKVIGYGVMNGELTLAWTRNFEKLFSLASRELVVKSSPLVFALAEKNTKKNSPTRGYALDYLVIKILDNPNLLPEDYFLLVHTPYDSARSLVLKNPKCPKEARVVGALMAGKQGAL